MTQVMTEELWRTIEDFPKYSISNYGRIHNDRYDTFMSTSHTMFGHVKISLVSDQTRHRHTLSVARLVGEAFVSPPDALSDQVVVLDGNLDNVAAWNLVWRPRWFAWKYARQLRTQPRRHYQILPVLNIIEDVEYSSIVEAGMAEGLLFDDIWRSTYSANEVYPHRSIFTILHNHK